MLHDLDQMDAMISSALSFLRDGAHNEPLVKVDLASPLQSAGVGRSCTARSEPRLSRKPAGSYVTNDALRARLGCSADRKAATALTTTSASARVISSSTSLPIASAITVSSKPAMGGVLGLNAPRPRSIRV